MVPSKHRIRPAASNDLAVPSLCICLLFVSVPLLVSVILCLTIIVLNAGSRRQWSAFLTTKKVLRYDACAVKSDFCLSVLTGVVNRERDLFNGVGFYGPNKKKKRYPLSSLFPYSREVVLFSF